MDATIPWIEPSGVSKTFGTGDARVQSLVDIDLRVHPGEVVGLLGPSGSGKRTLHNIIGCILEPASQKGTASLEAASRLMHHLKLVHRKGAHPAST